MIFTLAIVDSLTWPSFDFAAQTTVPPLGSWMKPLHASMLSLAHRNAVSR
jgi:hypothetical protein